MFLPTSAKEVKALEWDYIDVILFTGDAYIDHPAFGAAVIGRSLEAAGYRVAIVPQPNWQDDLRDFKKLGAPRLFFGVTAGAMDSTVMHYTPTRRLRSNDAYTPGGRHGARPDYPTEVYSRILRELYPDSLIFAGGIEASLRRFTHYDYLQDRLLGSFAYECNIDGIVYGMGERAIVELAQRIESGEDWRRTPQIALYSESCDGLLEQDAIELHSYAQCIGDAKLYAENFVEVEVQSNMQSPKQMVEPHGNGYVIVNSPYPIFTTNQCDSTYALPYMRQPAPRYKGKVIAAWDMIKNSINIHRGCYGGCSFCAISMHQGKFIASRSKQSIIEEIKDLVTRDYFRGTISDIGGPSANMWQSGGKDRSKCARCRRASCLTPKACPNLQTNHNALLELYGEIRDVERVKHLFVGSGIRYDMIDYGEPYFAEVLKHHTSGRFKVAPEHTEDHVVELMRKPTFDKYVEMEREFNRVCKVNSLPYVIVPYFISAHPGCNQKDMESLKSKTKEVRTDQVQDFTPTPMTLSSVMYYTGFDPYSGKKLYVARSKQDKDKQKSYFFDNYRPAQNRGSAYERRSAGNHNKNKKRYNN